MMTRLAALWAALCLASAPLRAQGPPPAIPGDSVAAVSPASHEAEPPADYITPHISDSHELELPYWKPPFHRDLELPRWEPIRVGGFTMDISPTKHVVFLLIAAILCCAVLITAAVAHRKHTHRTGVPRGFAAGIEAMVLYLRNEVILPNVGPHGDRFVPFSLTLFFFILFANLLGLLPWGSTPTGNISVTGALAAITFIVVEISGAMALGPRYIWTVVYWSKESPWFVNAPMTLIMTPVEIFGKFTKPFALAIRLFANMTAGHIVLLALIGLFFSFVAGGGAGALLGLAPILMSVAIMLLEIFVGFLQAFIFALLASVFIGQIRAGSH